MDTMDTKRLPLYFYIGIALISAMHVFIILGLDYISAWATPVFWTGLILLCDGYLYSRTGASIIKNRSIFVLGILSIISWWVFEWFNIFLANWHYINLVEPVALRYIGYFWAFGTILPGVILTHGVIYSHLKTIKGKKWNVSHPLLVVSFLTGLFFLVVPIIPFSMYYLNRAADPDLFIFIEWSANTFFSEFTALFVWLGFIFLLEPLNYLLGNRCLLKSFVEGRYTLLVSLSLAGLVDGLLWEFWNYWAHTKWVYTVPILGHIKLFEMPLLGYGGFIAFAWELYNISALVYPGAIAEIESGKDH